jgi:hypothetical protein
MQEREVRIVACLILKKQQTGDLASLQEGFGLSTRSLRAAEGRKEGGNGRQHGTRAATREGASGCAPGHLQTHSHQ